MALSAGDFVFVGFRADFPKDFSLLATVPVSGAAGERLTLFEIAPGAVGRVVWRITEDVAPGDIISFSSVDRAPMVSRGVIDPVSAPFSADASMAAVLAARMTDDGGAGAAISLLTTRACAADATEACAALGVDVSGLDTDAGRVTLTSDAATMVFAGPARFATKEAALSAVGDPASWATADGFAGPQVITPPGADLPNPAMIVCFVAGSRIRTPSGDRPVERLKAGERVVTLSGAARQVVWIGERHYDAAMVAALGVSAAPIRIAKGALGSNAPSSDLYVSRSHAIYVDGVLIPARNLVNGHSIRPATEFGAVSFYHVKLSTHDVIFANDAPTESYALRVGGDGEANIRFFDNADEYVSRFGAPERREQDLHSRISDPHDPRVVEIRDRLARRVLVDS